MIGSGSCGTTGATGSLITSASSCSAAATALDLSDKTAYAISYTLVGRRICDQTPRRFQNGYTVHEGRTVQSTPYVKDCYQ